MLHFSCFFFKLGFRLCGFPPFSEDISWHNLSLTEQIISTIFSTSVILLLQEGSYSFPSPWWDNISGQAKDLINKLLVVDPLKRLTIEGAMSHAFMQVCAPLFTLFLSFEKNEDVLSRVKARQEFAITKRLNAGNTQTYVSIVVVYMIGNCSSAIRKHAEPQAKRVKEY